VIRAGNVGVHTSDVIISSDHPSFEGGRTETAAVGERLAFEQRQVTARPRLETPLQKWRGREADGLATRVSDTQLYGTGR